MRIVFLGTPALVVPTLAAVAAKYTVAALVCQPDKPQGRSGAPVPPPTKAWALEHGIPVHQPVKLNDGTFEDLLRELQPDLGIVFAYGRLLKQPILDVPLHGWLNVHPSLLPRWRGPSPLQSAVLAGDATTGVTVMRITLEMDAGDILLQEATDIGPEETAEELTDRLAPVCARMLVEGIDQIAAGTAVFRPQDPAGVTQCTLLTKEHGYIRWVRPATEIHNQIRGCVPWPAAQCTFRGGVCKILRATRVPGDTDAAPGTVVAIEKDKAVIATGAGLIGITEFQAPGKKPLPMGDYARGARLQPGERFEDLV